MLWCLNIIGEMRIFLFLYSDIIQKYNNHMAMIEIPFQIWVGVANKTDSLKKWLI